MSRSLPNVVVIMVDQMKATASHLYGNVQCPTPGLSAPAERGVIFDRTYTPHPLCAPARIAMWTAKYSHETGCRNNQSVMPSSEQHAFKVWKKAGYKTGLIGKNHCFNREVDDAYFDVWCEISHRGIPPSVRIKGMEWVRPAESIAEAHSVRGSMPPTRMPQSHAVTDFPLADYATSVIAAQTVEFIEQSAGGPFTVWVSIPDPHEPYEAPRAFADLFPPSGIDLPPTPHDEFKQAPERNRVLAAMLGWASDEADGLRAVVATYYAMVRFADDAVTQITNCLGRLGLTDTTIVAFCSDHGDFAGEHAMMVKGGFFYDCLTRVPLIVSGPGVPHGRREPSLVSLIDLVPTLLALQGLDPLPNISGRILPISSGIEPRVVAFSEYGCDGPPFTVGDLDALDCSRGYDAMLTTLSQREREGRRAMVVEGGWKFVHDPTGDRDELYDLLDDPWEHRNLAESADQAGRVQDLRAKLEQWRSR